jgi:hypothetical protein
MTRNLEKGKRMKTSRTRTSLAAILCVALASLAWAEDKSRQQASGTEPLLAQVVPPIQQYDREQADPADASKEHSEAARMGQPTLLNKASGLIGIGVQNPQGEKLGEIRDLVIDLDKGTVSYLVLGTGGVLGVGEKLLAVPLTAFTCSEEQDKGRAHLVLHADRESIARAEGMGDAWPTVQEPSFGAMPFWQEPEGKDLIPDEDRPLDEPDKPLGEPDK